MEEVEVSARSLDRLEELLTSERAERLAATAERARSRLAGRTIWNVNTTAKGGGVAEMLQGFLAYSKGAGVQTRWLVLRGDAEFFAITKRLHNVLHGARGDGGELGAPEQAHYQAILAEKLESMRPLVRPGDIVVLHDPQTAGLTAGLKQLGAVVVWRCHIGRDHPSPLSLRGWAFLRESLASADALVFSRLAYAPDWVPADKLSVIPPSLDPFSAKNAGLTPAEVAAALRLAHLVDLPLGPDGVSFGRRDGTAGTVREHHGLILNGGGAIPGDARVILQVSRWDRLKDMVGVLQAFCEHVELFPPDAHLLLAGPEPGGVSDDPEAAAVLTECLGRWRALDPAIRRRIHLACMPMDDVDENAHLINALQRHAAVVVQKSLVEGFGLTVTEPMWKGRPVVASAVGGIQDQIVDEVHGLLLPDPRDRADFAAKVARVLTDPELAERLGTAAHQRVREQFLSDRHLIQYAELFERFESD